MIFPPYELINTLPPDAQKAFDSKAVAHSDEYYQAFKDQLLQRIKRTEKGSEPEPIGRSALSSKSLNQQLVNANSITFDGEEVELHLKKHINGSEKNITKQIVSVREQVDESEQAVLKRLTAQGRDMAVLIQAIESRLSSQLEARIREVKEEVLATSHGVRDAIIRASFTPQSSGGAPQAQYLEDPLEVILPSQRQAETGGSPMASRSPAAGRASRLFSARPQSGSPAHRSPSHSQGGVGSGLVGRGVNRSYN